MIQVPVFSRPVADIVSAARSFLRIAREPAVEHILALRWSLLSLMGQDGAARLSDALRSAPELAEMFAGGYLAPDYRVEDLAGRAPGTLGHAFYRFMTDNGLSQDDIPRSRPETNLGFHARRVEETHDLWHVVLGYQPDLPGEIGILSFFVGHLLRAVRREHALAARFVVLLILAFLVHVAACRPRLLPAALANLVRGARRGLSTRPLWAVRWEEMWDRPLAEIQAEYLA